jgi:iron complex outermembrane recepter protein
LKPGTFKSTACAALLSAVFPLSFAQQNTSTLPRVEVTGTLPVTGNDPAPDLSDFGSMPLRDLPLSVGITDSAALSQRGAKSLSQAIAMQPAASDAYNTLGYIESLSVRGFVLNNLLNYRRSGLAASNHAPVALENIERIELLKGVAGMVAGSSAPGGMLNYVIKRPTLAPLRQVNLELSERGLVLAHLDYSGRAANNAVGFRINAAAQERKPQPSDADGSRSLLAAALDYAPNARTYVLAQAEWHRVKQITQPGFGLLDTNGDGVAETVPPPFDPRINLNNQPWTQPFESTARTFALRAEHAVSDAWRVSFKAQHQSIKTNDRVAFPDGCSNGPTYVYPGFCSNYDVDVYDYRSDNERRSTRSAELSASGTFLAAGLKFSPSIGMRSLRYSERAPQFQAYNYVGFTNPFAPQILAPDPSLTMPNLLRDTALDELFANTSIAHGPLTAWLGVRASRIHNASSLTDGSEAVNLREQATQPWVGASWRVNACALLYASFSQGTELEAVPNRPDRFANAGAALPALESTQIEIGWRQSFAAGNASVALFDIHRDLTEDIGAAPATRITGTRSARHRGIEAALNLQLAAYWQLDTALALLDARIHRAQDAALIGQRATNVPRTAGNVALTWQPKQPWLDTMTHRLRYSGAKPVTPDNTVALPASWQWDADAQWSLPQLGKNTLLRAGIDNITNRRYWREAPTQSWGGTYLMPAMPRSFRLAVSAQF